MGPSFGSIFSTVRSVIPLLTLFDLKIGPSVPRGMLDIVGALVNVLSICSVLGM